MRRPPMAFAIIAGVYVALLVLALVATLDSLSGDVDGLNFLYLGLMAFPWTVPIGFVPGLFGQHVGSVVYAWLLFGGGLINCSLVLLLGSSIRRSDERAWRH